MSYKVYLYNIPRVSDFIEPVDSNHDRQEIRRIYSLPAPALLRNKEAWTDLNRLIMVEATRELNGQGRTEQRFYRATHK